MKEEINKIFEIIKKQDLDIVFLNDPANIFYFTGYDSEPHERILAAILTKKGEVFLFTPELEKEDALKAAANGVCVFSYRDSENPWQKIHSCLYQEQNFRPVKWAIEKDFLTVQRLEALQQVFPDLLITEDIGPAIQKMKVIKNEDALTKMRRAGFWADEAVKIGAKALKSGISEQEVVAEIEYQLKKRGITEMSFDTMVLFGKNAASPHGVPGTQKLEWNEFVLFDLGVMVEGYASDITRTLFFGDRPSEHQLEIYHLVKSAHDLAVEKARTGMTAEELDQVARQVIADRGYGDFFNHRLGHGLGQSVHEFPSLMAGNTLPLEKGMCFSIEPGIYLPDDVGVRIEDCGYLDENGFHSFTHLSTEWDAYQQLIQPS